MLNVMETTTPFSSFGVTSIRITITLVALCTEVLDKCYVKCDLLIFSDIQIITGSEDGTARIWGKNLAFFNFEGLWQKVVKNLLPLQLVCFCIKSHGLVLRSMCL